MRQYIAGREGPRELSADAVGLLELMRTGTTFPYAPKDELTPPQRELVDRGLVVSETRSPIPFLPFFGRDIYRIRT